MFSVSIVLQLKCLHLRYHYTWGLANCPRPMKITVHTVDEMAAEKFSHDRGHIIITGHLSAGLTLISNFG